SNGEPPLEPDCQVDRRHKERKEHRNDGVTLQLVSNLRADGLGADDMDIRRPLPLHEKILDLLRDRLGAAGCSVGLLRFLRPNGEFTIRAELLNLSALDARGIERPA